MALVKRELPKDPNINDKANTKRNTQGKKVLTAQDRKNYEFIDEILEFYIANNLTEREQRILKNITSNNK